ncbi:acyltransferase family protein [Eggerthellaceae bacterium zg-887]|uniref:acyltransferase n=1 Tax=Xiamenia xianingshaonis TaxID=2682776 RepID=UPI0014094D93|nr:acyltransferase [Xiamenia xianingshaonis]NHM16164.1 acyltransferase family protein [Xiamenia xianingshaonis]
MNAGCSTPNANGNLSSKGAKRIVWLDYARAAAILAVILCHSAEAVYSYHVSDMSSYSIYSQIVAHTLLAIGRLGVPLFLFISGYLMLDREYSAESCISFWKKKWVGLLLATEVWTLIYNVFLCFAYGQSLDFGTLVRNLLFLEPVNIGHMWYMPMILGMYLFLPFIANGLRRVNDVKVLAFPLLVVIIALFVPPLFNAVSRCFGCESLLSTLDAGFSGGVYGCYILLGYCVKKGVLGSIPLRMVLILGFISFASVVLFQEFIFAKGVEIPLWYSNGILLLAGFFLFVTFSRGHRLKESFVIQRLSYYSFALYLVHYPLKLLLAPVVIASGLPSHLLQTLVIAAVVLMVSLFLCALIRRIPVVGAKILYLKNR